MNIIFSFLMRFEISLDWFWLRLNSIDLIVDILYFQATNHLRRLHSLIKFQNFSKTPINFNSAAKHHCLWTLWADRYELLHPPAPQSPSTMREKWLPHNQSASVHLRNMFNYQSSSYSTFCTGSLWSSKYKQEHKVYYRCSLQSLSHYRRKEKESSRVLRITYGSTFMFVI